MTDGPYVNVAVTTAGLIAIRFFDVTGAAAIAMMTPRQAEDFADDILRASAAAIRKAKP